MAQVASSVRTRDRRAAERIPTSLRGKVFPGAIDCVIADFTKQGARLRFESAAPSGDHFIVVVWSSGQAFEADARWREAYSIGVSFVASRDLRRPAPESMADAQAMW